MTISEYLASFAPQKSAITRLQPMLARAVLAYTGMRPAELLDLTISNLDASVDELTWITDKTGVQRTEEIPEGLTDSLCDFFNFHTSFRNFYRTYYSLRRSIQYFYNLDIREIENGHNSLYLFRYIFVARLIDEGKTRDQIKERLGHLSYQSTDRYIDRAEQLRI